jgi:flagellar biosynthesis protein FlhB
VKRRKHANEKGQKTRSRNIRRRRLRLKCTIILLLMLQDIVEFLI